MEKTEDEVGALYFFDILDPFLSTTGHLLKFNAFPDILSEPVGNGGREHADDGNLHTINIMDGVRLQTIVDILRIGRTIRAGIDDVGTEQRTTYLAYPLVIYFVTRFDVVVTYRLCIVVHVVDDLCCQVLVLWHYIVRPIYTGLALKDVTIVDEQEMVIAVFLSFLINICISP